MPEEKKIVYVTNDLPELRLPPKGTKWKCTGCGMLKEATEENFEAVKIKAKSGTYYLLRRMCRVCRHGQSREYRISHKNYYAAAQRIARQIKKEGGEI